MSPREAGVSTVIHSAGARAIAPAWICLGWRRRIAAVTLAGACRNGPATRSTEPRTQGRELPRCYLSMALRGETLTMSKTVTILGLALILLANAAAIADD